LRVDNFFHSRLLLLMSHKKLRNENTCLNCGHEVEERFCTHCGQENLELKDSALHLIIHYVQDLFHYDGKLWHTLKALVLQPGLVAKEYMAGKRQSHLEPIRFYVFASSVFFLTFFLVLGSELYTTDVTPETNYSKRLFNLKQEKEFRKGHPDTTTINLLITSLRQQAGDSLSAEIDTITALEDSTNNQIVKELDSMNIHTTPQMGWLEKVFTEKEKARKVELEKLHGGDVVQQTNALIQEVVHKLPQLFFLSLPFFALFLKLLYWRSRKSAYVEHFIFSIYHYAFLFSLLLLYILVGWLTESIEGAFIDSFIEWLVVAMIFYPFIYLFLSMKRFYDDTWGKLTLRYFILMVLLFITLLALFIVLAVFAYLF
jgi:hypothetical protein